MPKYKEKVKSHDKYLSNLDRFCADTIKTLKSEKICPRSARWLGAYEIVAIAQRIHTLAHEANETKVSNVKEKEDRHALQTQVIALIKTLGEKYEFCSGIYDIHADSLNKWLEEKGRIQSWVESWQKNEETRYKDIG